MCCILADSARLAGPARRRLDRRMRGGRMPRQRFAHALLLTVLLLAVNFFASPRVLTAQETPTVRTPPQQQTEPPGNAPIAPGDTQTESYTLSYELHTHA